VKKSRVIIIVVVVVLVVVAGGGMAVRSKLKGPGRPTPVRIEKAELGELAETVSAPGEIEPKTKVEISAKVSARIVELPYEEGDTVTRGDENANPPVPASLLLRLDAKDLETRLKSAEASRDAQVAQVEVDKAVIESQRASLEGLAASVEQARRDMERQKGLLETKDIAQATFDQAKATCDELVATHTASTYTLQSAERRLIVMKHNLEVADAGIAQAKETLSYTTITSPIDGTITRINAEVGELVMTGTMNNPGTVIMVVGDLSKMLIVAQVAEADVAKLEVGQKAIAHIDAFGDKEFAGVVHSIALSHDVTDIETRKHADILKLPTQAVLGRELENLPVEIREKSEVIDKEKTFTTVVYRYVDGKAVVTPVKIGESDLTHTVIESGITADDKIVVGPYKVLMSIKHDQMVEDERESAKKKPGAGAEPEEDATDDANDTL
jgi:HlyD family secretion protein